MRVVDTNVIIRLLAEDDVTKSQATKALFERAAAGQESLLVPEVVIAEAVYVLGSPRLYAMAREGVARRLRALVNLTGVHVPNKARCLAALSLFENNNVDYADAVCAAYAAAEPETTIYSYDGDFDGLGVTRAEP